MGPSYATNPLIFLISTAFTLYILALMLRFLLQASGANYYNPISQFIARATSPVLGPFQRLIPRLRGIDLSPILVMFLLQGLAVYIVLWLHNGIILPVDWLGTLALDVTGRLIGLLLNLYTVLIFIAVIVSWVNPGAHHPGLELLHQIIDPIMRPIRSVMPDMGGIDLSPLVALVGLHLVRMLVVYPLRGQIPVPM